MDYWGQNQQYKDWDDCRITGMLEGTQTEVTKSKVNTANGKVSSNGSLLEVSPSLFSPFLLLKKDPVMSPSNAVNPRNVPIQKATVNSFVEPSDEDSHP